MKQLKNLIALSNNVKIFVPSTINVDVAVDTSLHVEETLKVLSQCFGGATSYKALGAWVAKTGKLVTEQVTICEAYCHQSDLELQDDLIYQYCLSLRDLLKQEAIALEVNGKLYFV